MPMHIYTSWVVHMHKLATLASIPWAQERPQESQGQDHDPRSKVTGPKFHAHADRPLTGSPHAQTSHNGINTLGTGACKNSQGQGHRTRIPCPYTSTPHG